MGLRDARRAAATAPVPRRSRPVARRARLLRRKPPRRERKGETAAGLDAEISDVSRGVGGLYLTLKFVIASEAKQSRAVYATLDCRVATLLAMTKIGWLNQHVHRVDQHPHPPADQRAVDADLLQVVELGRETCREKEDQ